MEERWRLRVPENCCDLSLSRSTSRLRELLVDCSIFSRSVAYSTCGEGGREGLKAAGGEHWKCEWVTCTPHLLGPS